MFVSISQSSASRSDCPKRESRDEPLNSATPLKSSPFNSSTPIVNYSALRTLAGRAVDVPTEGAVRDVPSEYGGAGSPKDAENPFGSRESTTEVVSNHHDDNVSILESHGICAISIQRDTTDVVTLKSKASALEAALAETRKQVSVYQYS